MTQHLTPKSKIVSVGKQITYFKIVTPAATGIIDTTNKAVSVTVPIGTVLTSLVTDISIAAGHTITPASGVAQNFSHPVVYTVKRPDNTTTTMDCYCWHFRCNCRSGYYNFSNLDFG
jgi:hypothetical protein